MESDLLMKTKMTNRGNINGVLVENNMEAKVSRKGDNYITGDIVIATPPLKENGGRWKMDINSMKVENGEIVGEASYTKISFYCKEITKAGKVNSQYGLLAKLVETPALPITKEPTMVKCSLQLQENAFVNRDGKTIVSYCKINGAFPNINKEMDFIYPEVEVEGYVLGTADVMDKEGIPTGAKKIKLGFLDYFNKLNVIDLDATTPMSAQFAGSLDQYDFLKFNVALMRSVKKEEYEEEVAFGEPIVKIREAVVSFREIKSATNPVPTVDNEDIAKLQGLGNDRKVLHDNMIEEKKAREAQKSNQAPAAGSAGGYGF